MATVKKTAAKTAIFEFVNQSAQAVSHADIQQGLGDVCDRVTIYRVLERLVNENLIHKIVNVDGVLKYASCEICATEHTHVHVHRHDHIHFSCQKCKSVTCLEDVHPTYQLPKKYKVMEVNFTVSGLCPKCV